MKKPSASPANQNALHERAPGSGAMVPAEATGNAGETHQRVDA